MIKVVLKALLSLYLLLFTINFIYADSNGVWHYASDIKGGIFGEDEIVLNYTFKNPVIFDSGLSTNSIIVSNKVGIGVLNPSVELEVNGKIKMLNSTKDSDSNQIVVTKDYLLSKISVLQNQVNDSNIKISNLNNSVNSKINNLVLLPLPPVCNGANKALQWNGVSWSCITISVSSGETTCTDTSYRVTGKNCQCT